MIDTRFIYEAEADELGFIEIWDSLGLRQDSRNKNVLDVSIRLAHLLHEDLMLPNMNRLCTSIDVSIHIL